MNTSLLALKKKSLIIRDKNGRPNRVFKLDKFNWDPVNGFNSTEVHPAFIVNGTIVDAIYIGQYQAVVYDPNTFQIEGDTNPADAYNPYIAGSAHNYIAQSIPNQDPRVKIDFDAARKACQNMNGNGVNGWHLMTNAEWSALALWCQANQMPLGNNSYGDDYSDPTVKGIMAPGNNFGGPNPSRWLTGTGGLKTAHNRIKNGVFDLNGNVWEWVDGMKLVEGKILVAGNLNAAPTAIGNSFQAAEANWFDTGIYVNWDGVATTISFSTVDRGTTMEGASPDYISVQFDDIPGADDNLKKLAIGPVQTGLNTHGYDHSWWRNFGERVPLRGGYWVNGSNAGVFALALNLTRGGRYWYLGFRPAFVAL
ncbi:SUMF1/EgtB/PvdO family nonheme iron enzyme [Caldithrix abyssi]|uniref:Sulfatase-modifying factor enzyme 1 n=1 Tax=Caldithrix abyssi DSM 13497 TaxID=880073 RepID=A0A1J1C4Q0_CALAY|nr:SUMF1/EgtB/PvdO family nonheme iron enzyme [Caldithrix abyssi]APF16994.1 Sulfatase-modifying factor enzyme 1 [Caldithrix abyssi DSM 13497]